MRQKPEHRIDPDYAEVDQLRKQLLRLAGEWRRLNRQQSNPTRRDEIVREYRVAMLRLLDSERWDEYLPVEALLPEELLPKELLQRYPQLLDSLDEPWPKRSGSITGRNEERSDT